MAKLLFILKRRHMTSEEHTTLGSEKRPNFKYCISSGLRNSARFVVDMLNENGIEAKLVEVIDNNCIDREVGHYKPTHVIIEAFWVVPEKFEILTKIHPKVKWIIRNHSEVPFMANEGIAVDWTIKYLQFRDVYIAPNSLRCFEDTKKIIASAHSQLKADYKVLYLPNYYKIHEHFTKKKPKSNTINVGCFGALRPLKNQLIQAIAAVHFAQKHGKSLRFHINVARIEDNGNNVLKNIRSLFNNLDPTKFKLIEHGWLDHKDFLKLVETMDIGLQASFTETFNIVAADFVAQGIPIVVSNEIEWMPNIFVANHTSSEDVADKMEDVLSGFYFWNKGKCALNKLKNYNNKSIKVWKSNFLNG
jgi:hypothetical protein